MERFLIYVYAILMLLCNWLTFDSRRGKSREYRMTKQHQFYKLLEHCRMFYRKFMLFSYFYSLGDPANLRDLKVRKCEKRGVIVRC
jgi:hypothetical protein